MKESGQSNEGVNPHKPRFSKCEKLPMISWLTIRIVSRVTAGFHAPSYDAALAAAHRVSCNPWGFASRSCRRLFSFILYIYMWEPT